MSTPDQPKRGRPELPPGAAATLNLVLRVKPARMAAYKTAARRRKRPDGKPDTLSAFCFAHLDAAAGYCEEKP